MREKMVREIVTSQIKYEENKLLSFHRSSEKKYSFRVYRDGNAGIHYQVGEMDEAEGFALAEENLKARPRPYPFEAESGKRSRNKTEREVTDKELMDTAKECMVYICETYPRFVFGALFEQEKVKDFFPRNAISPRVCVLCAESPFSDTLPKQSILLIKRIYIL